ncbi:MAG: SPOR domain-containing protein [Candidatus Binataceae bacterium]
MRFEIRTGGAFVVLVGLMALSGAVFALGMVAGYEMARQNQPDPSQLASVYPLPPAPADGPSVDSSPDAMPTAALPARSPARESAPGAVAAPAAGVAARLAPSAAPSVARAIAPPAMSPGDDVLEVPPPSSASSMSRPAMGAVAPKGKGYNIQIGGAMDRDYANEIVTKLKGLGYQPYTIEMTIDGKKWYRVRVGPFASENEAHAAQERLKDEYRSAYAPE